MEANKLRVNNWILWEDKYFFINGIKKHMSEVYVNDSPYDGTYRVNLDDINPIPLTEELLLKCGFSSSDAIMELQLNKVNITVVYYDGWNISIRSDIIDIDYFGYPNLHEFQNMVSLTGEELKIEL